MLVMQKETRKRKWLWTIIAFIFAVGSWIYLFTESPIARQISNLRKAAEHLKVLEKEFDSAKQFANIRFGVCTGGGGCILIDGIVKSQKDLALLKKKTMDTKPPVKILYLIAIQPSIPNLKNLKK